MGGVAGFGYSAACLLIVEDFGNIVFLISKIVLKFHYCQRWYRSLSFHFYDLFLGSCLYESFLRDPLGFYLSPLSFAM